jgi:Fuc2NAc and GlcNAc transferase
MDIPNNRSSHTVPTPRGGGLAVVIAWFTGLSFLYFGNNLEVSLFYALLSGIPLTFVGIADDILNVKPGIRFAIQSICAGVSLLFLQGMYIPDLSGSSVFLTGLFSSLAFIGILWSINLYNFLDGIDGYIATEVIFIGLAIYIITGDNLGLLLAVSVSGFLAWNWPKARIFMGDAGSTLLGFTIAILAIFHQNQNVTSIWVWLILTSLFWFDASITLVRRIINREKISEAHRKHAYQRIVRAGVSHRKTVLFSIVLNVIGFGFAYLAHSFTQLAWIFLISDLLILALVLLYIDKRKPFDYKDCK